MAQLPNPFIPNSVAHPPNSDAADTAGVAPQPPVAPAGTIQSSCGSECADVANTAECKETHVGVGSKAIGAGVAPGPQEAIPASTGGPQEAPAPRCTEQHDDAGATDCISEIFHYARKLMKQPPRFVLDEAAFMADVEEVPLFIREDGYLQRREA